VAGLLYLGLQYVRGTEPTGPVTPAESDVTVHSIPTSTAPSNSVVESSSRRAESGPETTLTASDSSGGVVLRIRVVSARADGPAIANAEVFLGTGRVGLTDENGALTIDLGIDASNPIVLRVGAIGHAPVELELEPREARIGPVVVVLAAEAFLHGQVRLASGEATRSLVRIACSRSDRWPDAAALEMAFAGVPTPRIRVVDAADDGTFTIGGLDPKLSYMLMPSGCGYTAIGDFTVAATGDSPVTLTVAPLFGALVLVRGPGGSELSTSPRLLGGGPGWDSQLPGGTEHLFPTPAQLSLFAQHCAGEATSALPSRGPNSWTSTLLLFAGGGDGLELQSTVGFGVQVPGCEPVSEQIPITWLGEGLRLTTVTARPLTNCFGALQIVSRLAIPGGWKAPGVLTLRSESSKESFSCAIDLADPMSLRVQGVPCGEYRASFAARDSLYRWSRPSGAAPIRVVTAGAADIGPIVAPELGALEVHFVGSNGEEYDGSVLFSLEFGEGASTIGESVEFFEGPYRIALVQPGSWYVRVILMNGGLSPLEPRTPVVVVAGGTVSRAFVPLAKP